MQGASAFFLFTAVLVLALLCCAPRAAAVSYTATVDGERKSALLNAYEVQGVSYLSLPALARQLGGEYRVTPVRISVDLAGTSASVGLNDTRVDGPRGTFSLQFPVILRENDVLIAAADIPAFFSQGLLVALQGTDVTAVPSEPVPPAPDFAPPAPPADTRVEVQDLTVAEPPDEQLLNQMPTLEPARLPVENKEESIPEQPAAQGPLHVIVLDPGHGGNDTGMTGPGGFMEKDLTLALATRVRDRLKQLSGATVFLTREEDKDLSGNERCALANQKKGGLLISIHAGASYSPAARGVEVFHATSPASASTTGKAYHRPSQQYANCMANEISAQCGAPSRGVRATPLRILHEATMPGILVEAGCMTNNEEAAALATGEHQAKIAEGIAQGIIKAGAGGKSE